MINVVINRGYGGFVLSADAGFVLSADALIWLADKQSPAIATSSMTEFCNWYYSNVSPVYIDALIERFTDNVRGSYYTTDVIPVVYDRDNDIIIRPNEDMSIIEFRTHPDVVEVVETLGQTANGEYAQLKIVRITDADVTIDKLDVVEYDGVEHVIERSRMWK